MMYGKAPMRKQKRWARRERRTTTRSEIVDSTTRAMFDLPYSDTEISLAATLDGKPTSAIGTALHKQLEEHARTQYTIMVRFVGKRNALRMAKDGTTTNRKANALLTHGYIEAERYAAAFNMRDDVERAWVAEF